jgi:deazaflavin-dependent oxidoreductase (nitroreductase family)
MRRTLGYIGGGLVLAVVTIAVVFIMGMRTKKRPVVDTVRRLGRATKPLVLRSAGQAGTSTAVIHHVGRATGRSYATPVEAMPAGEGFAIALPYGLNTDWLKNVLASGSARIVREGEEHVVDQPQVVTIAEVNPYFSASNQRAHRLFGVQNAVRVRTVDSTGRSPAS